MPKDTYVFLALLAALVVLQFLNLPRGLFFAFFFLIVIGQGIFLAYGFTRFRRRGR